MREDKLCYLCHVCKKDLEQETEALSIDYHRVKRKDIDSEAYLVAERYLDVCSLQCMIKLLDSLKEEHQKEVDKDKTNAVGPTMKGSPGCAHGS